MRQGTGAPVRPAAHRPTFRGVAFRAVPDSGRLPAVIGPDGRPTLSVPGHIDLPALRDPAVTRTVSDLWFAPGSDLVLPPRTEAVVNLCADPNLCELGILALDAALPGGMAVLNHPRAVARARRDLAGAVFGNIPGLRVPAAARFVATSPSAFAHAFKGGGFRYPVDLRPAGTGGPRATSRVSDASGWQAVLRGAWGRRVWVMTQAQPGPQPWKLALCMVGREAYAEVLADGGARPAAPPPRPSAGSLTELARAALDRLPLDCWTLVVSLVPEGYVFDRAMPGLAVPHALPGRLDALLAAPECWRGAEAAALGPVAAMFAGPAA
jgi:hypothetical protein